MSAAGATILVTGSTDGLGRAAARELAAAGASVLVHGRDPARVADVVSELPRARGYVADLSSLREVRRLAAEVEAAEPRLDVLVANAGVGPGPRGGGRELSQDGHELRFAVNYLAHFLLAELLLPLLRGSAPARIVAVSSAGQQALDLDDLQFERGYGGLDAYRRSKLAQILHTFDLAERLAGSGVTVNALHPAVLMPTKMVAEHFGTTRDPLEQGVRALVRLAVGAAVAGLSGRYFDGLREGAADPQAYDPAARRRLREASERLVGRTPTATSRTRPSATRGSPSP